MGDSSRAVEMRDIRGQRDIEQGDKGEDTVGLIKKSENTGAQTQGSSMPPFESLEEEPTCFEKHVRRNLNKGTVSNLCSFFVMALGLALLKLYPDFTAWRFIMSFGLFAFSGGFTNWLAIKMLFDKIPFLYGSGVIPKRFKEIRETVKNVIMKTFFDQTYLEKYLNQKAGQWLGSLNLEDKIKELLESPVVDQIIESKLTELSSRPEGMFLAMMGVDPLALKPMIKPFVLGMGTDVVPHLFNNFEVTKLINIETIRTEIDSLMSTKLLELTPERVKLLLEEVMREHLGWLIVWGNVFGGLIGLVSQIVETFAS